jgi:hypothetical protein
VLELQEGLYLGVDDLPSLPLTLEERGEAGLDRDEMGSTGVPRAKGRDI